MDVQAPITPSNLFSAKGLVVVITGGGSGIGLAIAAALHQTGAQKIYLLGRRTATLNTAIETLISSPSAPKYATSDQTLIPIQCDVTSTDSINAAVALITRETGHVDVLINNAGIIGPRNAAEVAAAESIEQVRDAMVQGWDQWDMTMATNTSSVIGVSSAFLPLLEAGNKRRGWQGGKVTGHGNARKQDKDMGKRAGFDEDEDRLSQIITVASVASFMRIAKAGIAYNASKAAAAHLGKMLSTMLAEWGIRSNVVCPGPFPSEMTAGRGRREMGPDECPTGRMGDGKDVAGLILFLVGKGGSYINGSVQLTDGGRLGVFPSVY